MLRTVSCLFGCLACWLALALPAQAQHSYPEGENRPDLRPYRVSASFDDPLAGELAPSMAPAQAEPMPNPDTLLLAPVQANISRPPGVDTLEALHRAEGKLRIEKRGYRIQVFTGEREAANDVRLDILTVSPDEDVYFIYEKPLFKVRVGNFTSKYEAEQAMMRLRNKYPGAFLVPTNVLAAP